MRLHESTAHEGDVAGPAGYLELVRRNVNFRRLWLGNIISLLGDWFNFIALVSLVGGLTGSPLAVGLVFIAKMLPWALVSPVAGLLVDRFNRRRLMIGSDVLRAAVVLGFLLVDDAGDAYLVYALTTVQVVIGSVFQPAKEASIPNIVAPRELLTANALNAATWSVMLAVGAGLGGVATDGLGIRAVFVIDSLTYLVSAFFIYRTVIPQATEAPGRGPLLPTALRTILEGWRHIRTHPPVGRITLAKAMWAVAGGALVFMLTLLGERLLPGLQAAGIGLLFMARGIGTGVGPVLTRALFKDEQYWPALLGACVVFSGLCYASVGFMPWAYAAASAGLIFAAVVAAHAASGANWVLATVLLQQRTEDRYRGRVFATEWLLVMLADSVAILASSLLLEYGVLDLRVGFLGFALVQVLCGLLWMLLIVPKERAEFRVQRASERAAS